MHGCTAVRTVSVFALLDYNYETILNLMKIPIIATKHLNDEIFICSSFLNGKCWLEIGNLKNDRQFEEEKKS
ncbi:hypothetical protein T4D_10724 [Trichinella pseudospiralis]|uniref:Uncharacterized protein n=1 Tax=Trichinella pseudospiralis TaxID=6337 RepID=A0A0V1FTV6_TRIPS|nr:hypothetical protein T4D_10724 [Trichinella pseudospiralis]